jgi:hypothetical protein
VIEASRWAEDVRLEVLQIPVANSVAEAGDGLIAGVKDRGSDADVLHDATSLNNWNNPIGRPATPPPPPAPVMAMGNRCATAVGVLAYWPPPPPRGQKMLHWVGTVKITTRRIAASGCNPLNSPQSEENPADQVGGPSPPLGPFFAPRLRSGSMNN